MQDNIIFVNLFIYNENIIIIIKCLIVTLTSFQWKIHEKKSSINKLYIKEHENNKFTDRKEKPIVHQFILQNKIMIKKYFQLSYCYKNIC